MNDHLNSPEGRFFTRDQEPATNREDGIGQITTTPTGGAPQSPEPDIYLDETFVDGIISASERFPAEVFWRHFIDAAIAIKQNVDEADSTVEASHIASWLEQAVNALKQLKRAALLLASWLKLEIPPRDYILGHVLCTTSRWLVYGETGVGKTLVGMDMAAAAASGSGFLNWPGSGIERRVMYLDGELPAETFKERMELLAERYGPDVELYGYNRDVLSDGEMPPLNTPEGEAWLLREIDVVEPDLIVFDSIMCLLTGSMAEEESWAPVKELVRKISKRRIAQVWLHHTGHDTSKGFGTKTREWEMDTVIGMTRDTQNDEHIQMEFKKARLRTPKTREQFEPLKIACEEGGWTIIGDGTKAKGETKPESQRATMRREFRAAYHQLANDVAETPGLDGRTMVKKVGVDAIRDHLKKRGRLDVEDDGRALTPKGRTDFKDAKLSLTETGGDFIEDDGLIWALYPDRPQFTFHDKSK